MSAAINIFYAQELMDIQGIDFEEDLAVSRSSAEDLQFDTIVGCIEDIIMEEEFQSLQNGFLEKYYLEFEDTEENKFIYTDIHEKYINLIEKFLANELTQRIPGFSMQEFSTQIINRKNELEGEIFEMLLTFSDFVAFKEMLIDYRADKEGTAINFGDGLTVHSMQPTSLSLFGESIDKQ